MLKVANFIYRLSLTFSERKIKYFFLLLMKFSYFSFSRKFFLRGKEMSFKLTYNTKTFHAFIDSNVDLAALYEIFVMEEYRWDEIKDPKIIIDLGAHFGDTALYYSLKYPDAHIYAIEPTPETFRRLLRNTSSFSNITTIQAGVADKDGIAELNITPSSLGNSLKTRSLVQGTLSVPVYTLQSLFLKFNLGGADIIKFDIEGAEEMLFSSIDNPSYYGNAFIGEVHQDLIRNADAFIGKFSDFNVRKIQLSNPNRFIMKALKK
jgi:FkbM family methyltransferase